MYRWIFFLGTEIEQPLWRIARHTFIYPEDKRLPQDAALARQECLAMVAVLERHMAGREFMAGDRLSVADFTAAHTLEWAKEAEMLDDAPRERKSDVQGKSVSVGVYQGWSRLIQKTKIIKK